jgi:hypothetical protein
MQSVDDEHETARKELNLRDLSGGVGVMTQRWPRQTSARVIQRSESSTSVPTALQKMCLTHDTPSRWLSLVASGAGVGCTRQALPFHEAASGTWALAKLSKYDPTATQALAPVQSTPLNPPFPDGFGDFCTVQKALVFPAGAADARAADCALIVKSVLSKKQIAVPLRMQE